MGFNIVWELLLDILKIIVCDLVLVFKPIICNRFVQELISSILYLRACYYQVSLR